MAWWAGLIFTHSIRKRLSAPMTGTVLGTEDVKIKSPAWSSYGSKKMMTSHLDYLVPCSSLSACPSMMTISQYDVECWPDLQVNDAPHDTKAFFGSLV